jgi:hypothetical protein
LGGGKAELAASHQGGAESAGGGVEGVVRIAAGAGGAVGAVEAVGEEEGAGVAEITSGVEEVGGGDAAEAVSGVGAGEAAGDSAGAGDAEGGEVGVGEVVVLCGAVGAEGVGEAGEALGVDEGAVVLLYHAESLQIPIARLVVIVCSRQIVGVIVQIVCLISIEVGKSKHAFLIVALRHRTRRKLPIDIS